MTARRTFHRWFMLNDVASLDGSFISALRLEICQETCGSATKAWDEHENGPIATGESERPTNHVSPKNVEITEKWMGISKNHVKSKAPWPVESAIFHCHSFERTKLGSLPVVTVRVTRKPRQVGCRLGSHKMTLWTVRKGICSSTIRINRCCISYVQMFRQKYQVYPSISSPSRVRRWERVPQVGDISNLSHQA